MRPLPSNGVWEVWIAGLAFRYSESAIQRGALLSWVGLVLGRPLLLRSDPYGGSCLCLVCPGVAGC